MIDLHAHVVLESVLGAAGPHGPELDDGDPRRADHRASGSGTTSWWACGYRGPFMDVGARLAAMDEAGIDLQVPSPNPLTFFAHVEADGRRRSAGATTTSSPRRRHRPRPPGGLAQLPMQDPRRAADELRRPSASSTCSAPHVGTDLGRPLDDPAFDVVWSACTDLDVPSSSTRRPTGSTAPARDERLARFGRRPVARPSTRRPWRWPRWCWAGCSTATRPRRCASATAAAPPPGWPSAWSTPPAPGPGARRRWPRPAQGRAAAPAVVGRPRRRTDGLAALLAAFGPDRGGRHQPGGLGPVLDTAHGDATLAATFDANARRLRFALNERWRGVAAALPGRGQARKRAASWSRAAVKARTAMFRHQLATPVVGRAERFPWR